MYCGTNKTACSSQACISEAMLRLMRVKPFNEISVSELCKEAGVSRQTFYSLFESRDNVVSFILRSHHCYEPVPEDEHPSCMRQLCHQYSQYIVDQSDFIRLLVQNHIIYMLGDSLRETLDSCECFLSGMDSRRRGYAADFLAGGFMSIAGNFIRDGARADVAELDEICLELFGGRIFGL